MVKNLILLGTQIDPSKVEAASLVSEISAALNIFIEFENLIVKGLVNLTQSVGFNKINWELLKSPKFLKDIERCKNPAHKNKIKGKQIVQMRSQWLSVCL